jgi:hypothetical protein
MTAADTTKFPKSMTTLGVVLAVVGAALVFMFAGAPGSDAFWKAFYAGWITWTGISLGCLGMLILHHLVRGRWAEPVLRIWEAGGGAFMMGVSLVMWAVITFGGGAEVLYAGWWTESVRAADPVLISKSWFLNQNAFILGSIGYYAIFILLGSVLTNLLKKEEKNPDKKICRKRTQIAGPGLVVFLLAATGAYTHWAMSLDAHWFSTIYAIWLLVGGAISALSLGIWIMCSQSNKLPYKEILNEDLMRDLSHMLLTVTLLWTYFTLSQYLIIWSGNMPEFTSYYLNRAHGKWGFYGQGRLVLQFFLPFLALLNPAWKRNPKSLKWIAIVAFFAQLCNWLYVAGPSLYPGTGHHAFPEMGLRLVTQNLAGGFLLVGGIWVLVFAQLVKKAPLLTQAHPSGLEEAPALEEAPNHA